MSTAQSRRRLTSGRMNVRRWTSRRKHSGFPRSSLRCHFRSARRFAACFHFETRQHSMPTKTRVLTTQINPSDATVNCFDGEGSTGLRINFPVEAAAVSDLHWLMSIKINACGLLERVSQQDTHGRSGCCPPMLAQLTPPPLLS